ncbi:methyl-accepting chemotaxis protein [Methylomonas sp. LL1]|uniref:methyl-accepting chemotaxis protein n=1 Tax=Methylomonas sp. LL1 TaxID=2785785 RepID=UPI0018C3D4BB|nr:methyl-accepting chemotaxis protein [Methylomonas sp. LL1]QPK65302.1 methyl-accepting chemotaxis protein [Methylomonas sp. LL1]
MNLSIRWKLQFSFFAVTMITTIYNRLLASFELIKMVEIAESGHASPEVITQLRANHSAYIFNSFWESGLEFVFQFFLIAFIANMFARPIIHLCYSLESVEKGDLTKHIANTSQDEVGVLQKIFNNVLNKLNNIMREIDASGKSMGQSAFQVAKISNEIADVSKREENRSAEVASAMQSLFQISSDVQRLGIEASNKARQVDRLAQDGIEYVHMNIGAMQETVQEVNRASHEIQELENSAKHIHLIIDTITDIASQTNLLALNAAIEAARAGEQGRGFAVVADEVRKLATRTSGSADEVNQIIRHLSDEVQRVTDTMSVIVGKVDANQKAAEKTTEAIEQISGNVLQTAQANQSIADASNQQLDQFRQLQATMEGLFATLKENAAKVEGTAVIGEDLRRLAAGLNSLMAGFTFIPGVTIDPAQDEKREYPRANNGLLVKIIQGGQQVEAVTRDFSLIGLSIWLTRSLNSNQAVDIDLFPTHRDMDQYINQSPVRIKARIVWLRQEGNRYLCGVEFLDKNASARQRIQDCFDFFNKNSEFLR